MSVVTAALGSLVPKLLQLLRDEYKLHKGVKKQVQWLHRELESICPFLEKVSGVPWDQLDGQVKVWADEVREASYDMEDIVDTFLVRVESSKDADSSSLMDKMVDLFNKAKARRHIARKIEDMKKHLDELAKRHERYKLDETKCKQGTSVDPRLNAMYKEVPQLIGVEESRDKLISMLNLSQPDHAICDKKVIKVSIVGVGGLGKTTLAKVVYNKLKSQYDCGAFVSIGRDRDLVKVFKDMLLHLGVKNHREIHDTGAGVHQLREFLKNKRYFIVIDDVWDVPTWDKINFSFLENNCGSKVITTTRNLDVANEAGDVYKLKPLSDDDSMKLLYTRIFSAEGKYQDKEPEDVINKIVKKCGGIPLAIMTMASLLAGKQKDEWSEVLKSIGFGSKGNKEVEETMKILSFSYYDLPPQLRTCLLYLNTYPEDYEIRKDSLIWKWVAEGFIVEKQGIRLFELGEGYFNELINRSLIQAVENEHNEKVLGCRVHDMVLDLLRKLSSEENFIAILGDNVEATPAPSNIRRLTHQNRIAKHINSDAMVTGMPKVRSYTAFKCFSDWRNQFFRFKLLRVLDIEHANFKEGCDLEQLGDLLHLRYLGIKFHGNDFVALPKQIGNLKFLQILDVGRASLPASILHLTKLVRLCTHSYVPDGIEKLVSLEELMVGPCYGGFLKELGSLQELRVLSFFIWEIEGSMVRDFVESLRNLKTIQILWVSGAHTEADTAMWEAAGFVLPQCLHHLSLPVFKWSKLPSCINPERLPILSDLTLNVTTMDEQDLKLLAGLPSLCYLSLRTESTVTASNINAGDGCFFRKLRHFRLKNTMVQFEQPNEEDTSVSLHVWNGKDAMPFASRKSNDSKKVVPSKVMPNLEVLEFTVHLRALKDNNSDCGNIGLEYLPSVRKLNGSFNCEDVSVADSNAAYAALRNACKMHPNNPTLDTYLAQDGIHK